VYQPKVRPGLARHMSPPSNMDACCNLPGRGVSLYQHNSNRVSAVSTGECKKLCLISLVDQGQTGNTIKSSSAWSLLGDCEKAFLMFLSKGYMRIIINVHPTESPQCLMVETLIDKRG
jgi:hypothetical protein